MTLAAQISLGFKRVGALIGLEKDWASQLNQALVPAAGLLAATKTNPGIVQLATSAQAIAGTDDLFALTSADLMAARLVDQAAARAYANRKDLTAAYTLVLADLGAALENTSSALSTVTIPANASVPFPVGARIYLYQGPNAGGSVLVTAGANVALRVHNTFGNAQTSIAWGRIALRQRAIDDWVAEEFDYVITAQIADILAGGRLSSTNKDVSNGDWNNQATTGFFEGAGMANAPGGDNGWSHVIVQRFDDSYVTQMATSFTVNGGGPGPGTNWVRQKRGGNWSPWVRLVTTGLGDSPVIDRGGTGIASNWNTLITPGVYLMNGGGGNPPGFPSGAYAYGHLLVLVSGQGVTQVYFPDGSSTLYWRHAFSAAAGGGFAGKAWQYLNPTGTVPAT